ncbi:hypothetical protein [Streptomyces sp. NPDC101150]
MVDGQEHTVKLGVWCANIRSRRASLTEAQRQLLGELGLFD